VRSLAHRAVAVAAGVLSDAVLGEPAVHPLGMFGGLMEWVEQRIYRDRRANGALHTFTGVAVGLAVGSIARSTTFATYLSVAPRALTQAARDVARAGNLDRARQLLPSLVSRDAGHLDESEIARAVIESVAENTVDAIVAPVVWGVLAGAPGTLAYRAVNTMDAMVGYKNERYLRYGWASARLDDVANYLPARLTVALVMLARPRAARAIWSAARQAQHPSPNAGMVEAAFAAALGLRLGGTNTYGSVVEVRPSLGAGRAVRMEDIAAAVTLCRDVTVVLVVLLLVAGWAW